MANSNKKTTNPWKGLNYYNETDRHNFYGRDEEIQSLSLYVINNTQTILYGKSGIGKSSIINAGVFPIAREAGLYPISIRFSHEEHTDYTEQLRAAFERNGIGMHELVPRIEGHKESLWEFMHRHTFCQADTMEPIRPLIVLDQFEEIFTLQHDEKKKLEFFAELADLLNEITPQYIIDAQNQASAQPAPKKAKKSEAFILDLGTPDEDSSRLEYAVGSKFNIVFVIREDFLSYLERYSRYIPRMKTNRYALLPLNEEQAAEIIMKPQPGLVNTEVATLIIQKVTTRDDFELGDAPEIEVDAAVLSLFLSGLYDKKPENEPAITAELVNQSSRYIIHDFYQNSIKDLPAEQIERLEDQLLTSDGRRNNVSRNDLLSEGISAKTLRTLIEDSKLLRQFSYQDDIRIEYMHDILCPVISERIEQREIARRQEEERQRQEEEQRRLLAEEQRKREAIEAQAKAERERMENEAKQMKQRVRRRMRIVAAIFLTLIAVGGLGFMLFFMPYSTYYANFTTENGWPVGLGQSVSPGSEQAKDLLQLYKLTKHGIIQFSGQKKPFSEVRMVSPSGDPVMNMLYEVPVVGLIETELNDNASAAFAKLQRQTHRLSYRRNSNGEMERCIAYGLNDSILYSIQYYRDNSLVSADSSKHTQWAVFYDATGKSMMVSDKGTDRMRQTVDNGYVSSCMFFTELGVPQQNAYGSYGYAYELDSASHMINVRYDVNEFGDRIESTALRFENDPETGRETGTKVFHVLYAEGMRIFQFPHFCDTLHYRPDGSLERGTFHTPGGEYSLIAFRYDDKGNQIMNQKFRKGTLVESVVRKYDVKTGRPTCIVYLENGVRFDECYSYPDSSTTEVSLMQNNKKCEVKRTVNEYNDTITYHKYRITESRDSLYHITTVVYMDTAGRPVNTDKGLFAKRVIKRDTLTNNTRLDFYYLSNGDIFKSTWYDYDEYGRQMAMAVAGIDDTPVRCSEWSWDNWGYYTLSAYKDNSNTVFVTMKGYDEFGDEAYITEGTELCTNNPMPIDLIQIGRRKNGNLLEFDLGISLAQSKRIPIDSHKLTNVPFLQLLTKQGTMYVAKPAQDDKPDVKRPLDGDVLYQVGAWHLYGSEALLESEWNKLAKNGGRIEVLRAEGEGTKPGTKAYYKRHSFVVAAGSLGAKYHAMPITETQQNRIKNAQ